jgi:purine nucleosidase
VDLAMGAPGSDIDDGFALALALAEPEITVELVTTVNGNTDVDTATVLTLELLHRLGRADVPLHRGAERPLLRSRERQGSVPDQVVVREPQPGIAAVAMVEHVLANPGQIALVAVGPLTNVALALRLHPGFATALKSLTIMGGVFNSANHNSAMPGEFNVWSDPEAAHIVLTAPITARWVGLDVTRQVTVTRAQALEMQSSERPFVSFAGEYTAAWIDHLKVERRHPDDSCAMHDPLAVAAVTHPELLTFRSAHVQVERGDLARGVMVTEYLDDRSDREPNAEVAVAVDAEGFQRLLLDRIREL